jgi:predicted nucleic acid-binding protein
MPARDSPPVVLLDTSAAIALLVADHDYHEVTFQRLADRELGLAGHAAFETFSVLTRLPMPARRSAQAVQRLLTANFPHNRFLSADQAAILLSTLAGHEVAGGSVYDALVGAAALEHGMTLVSRDQRALKTYRMLGVDTEVIP